MLSVIFSGMIYILINSGNNKYWIQSLRELNFIQYKNKSPQAVRKYRKKYMHHIFMKY